VIRVTFEMLPGGNVDRARTIGVMEVANVVTRPDGTADYVVVLKKTPPFSGALKAAWKQGRVTAASGIVAGCMSGEDDEAIVALAEGHHRTQRGVYDLLYRALVACGLGSRNRSAAATILGKESSDGRN
jgi:hypothetical protein